MFLSSVIYNLLSLGKCADMMFWSLVILNPSTGHCIQCPTKSAKELSGDFCFLDLAIFAFRLAINLTVKKIFTPYQRLSINNNFLHHCGYF